MTKIIWPLAHSTWGKEEEAALLEVIRSDRVTSGPKVREYEEAFAKHVGARYAVMTNSGSSANLIAVAALKHRWHSRGTDDGVEGWEAIVPAVAWSTTYAPLVQHGYTLRIVDVDLQTLNATADAVEAAINENTRLIVGVSILGNPAPMDKLRALSIKHGVPMLEDNCESFGARIGSRFCGTFGDIGTFSTFFTHHLNTIEGGVAVTDDPTLYEMLLCLRAHGWTKDLPENSLLDPGWKEQDQSRYRFLLPGYNVRGDELRAAAGLVQLARWPEFEEARLKNASSFQKALKGLAPKIYLQTKREEKVLAVPYAFTMVFQNVGIREEVGERLTEVGIEHRMITGGCFTQHPLADYADVETDTNLFYAEQIHHAGLFVANHPYNLSEEIEVLHKVLKEILI